MNTALQRALDDAGMSQSELARRVGRDQSLVNRWVRGSRMPTPLEVVMVADELEREGAGALRLLLTSPTPIAVDADTVLMASRVAAELGYRFVQGYSVEALGWRP